MTDAAQLILAIIGTAVAVGAIVFTAGRIWGSDRRMLHDHHGRISALEKNMVTKQTLDDLRNLVKRSARWGHRTNNLALEMMGIVASGSRQEAQIHEVIRRHRREQAEDEQDEDS